jgi:NTE family protein
VDAVTGSSAGALIGAFCCAGRQPDEIHQLLIKELAPRGWHRLIPSFGIVQLVRLLRGRLPRLIKKYITVSRLEDLPIPFAVSATDLGRGETILIDRGDIVTALMATTSIPGLARPVQVDGRYLVDGSLLCDLPLEPLQRARADVLIGVTLGAGSDLVAEGPFSSRRRMGLTQVLSRTIRLQLNRSSAVSLSNLDLAIEPRLGEYRMTDFDRLPMMADLGRRAAEEQLPRLLELLAKRRPSTCRNRRTAAVP